MKRLCHQTVVTETEEIPAVELSLKQQFTAFQHYNVSEFMF